MTKEEIKKMKFLKTCFKENPLFDCLFFVAYMAGFLVFLFFWFDVIVKLIIENG